MIRNRDARLFASGRPVCGVNLPETRRMVLNDRQAQLI